jgi:hypothetical protein
MAGRSLEHPIYCTRTVGAATLRGGAMSGQQNWIVRIMGTLPRLTDVISVHLQLTESQRMAALCDPNVPSCHTYVQVVLWPAVV